MAMVEFGDTRLPPHFWSKVAINEATGCWEWTASKRWRGYGRFGTGADQKAAHRVAYEALVGPIPAGLQTDHICRVTCCVNPAHLEPVTQRENMERSGVWKANSAKAKPKKLKPPKLKREPYRTPRKTHCRNGHAFTPENTYRNPHDDSQVCRACQRATWLRYSKRQSKAALIPRPW